MLSTELKSLIGYGAPKHALTRPLLRDLVLDRHPGLDGRELSQAICKELEAAAWRLPEAQAKACLVLLRLSGHTDSAQINRERAIALLGLHVSVEAFRRPYGPELDLMQRLADALLEPSGPAWAVECEIVSHHPLELRLRLRPLPG